MAEAGQRAGLPFEEHSRRVGSLGTCLSPTPADNRRFPASPAQGERAWRSTHRVVGPSPRMVPKTPRDRLAEIQAETHDVQQQIEQLRRAARVIRDAQDIRAWERQITELTDRLSGLLLAEAMQRASDQPENIQKARSLTQGAGHKIKDQVRRDVTLRTACGVVVVRVPYFSRNCDRARSGRGMYPILLLWGMHDRCTAALASEVSKLVAMLGSFEEVERVLADRGRPLDLKTIRSMAYRFAVRPGHAAGWGPELGRDRRGPARGPLRRRRPAPDPHDQARSQDGQGVQPLSHRLARAEIDSASNPLKLRAKQTE